MKIRSVNIVSFGKFKNYKIDFSDGFNVIYGQNEAGKSTVMSFIKMMFYGNGGRVSDIEKNLRKKYQPWDADLMAGSIEFSEGGKNYRLDREFRGSNSTDRITLTDTDLGVSRAVSGKGDIGSSVFGLSEAAFEKSVFIGTLGAPEKNAAAESELNSRLSNISSTGDEAVSYESVASRVRRAKEALMSRGGKIGAYDKAAAALEALNDEIRHARGIEAEAGELEALISQKESDAARLTAESNRYFEIMKKAELFKKRANLVKYISACETQDNARKALLLPDGTTAGKDYADRIREAVNTYELCTKTLDERVSEEQRLKIELEELSQSDNNALLSGLSAEKQTLEKQLDGLGKQADSVRAALTSRQLAVSAKPEKKPRTALVIAGLVLALAGGISAAVTFRFMAESLPLFCGELLGAAAGLVLFVLGLVLKRPSADAVSARASLAALQGELDDLLSQIAACEERLASKNSEINSVLIENGSKKALREIKQTDLIQKQEAAVAARSQLLDSKTALFALCEPLAHISSPEEALTLTSDIEKRLSDISSAEIVKNMAADGTNCKSYEEAVSRLHDLESDPTLRELTADEVLAAKDEFKRCTELSGRQREELATLKGRLKGLTASSNTVPVLELKQNELKNQLASQKRFCDSADIALEVLSESFADMRKSFSSVLESETTRIFKGLCDDAYSSVDISKDLEISVNREGVFGAKQWQFLSAGTADQAYLSLRLALAGLIGKEDDPLPVVMDDALAQYDDSRSDRAMKYLAEYAKQHQIILFTCHNNIKNTAERLGITTIIM